MAWPNVSSAHSFIQPYTLPIPFAYYVWGAVGALALSFVVISLFAATSLPALPGGEGDVRLWKPDAHPAAKAGRFASMALLILCIVTGLWGTQEPLINFNMTFFWIIFVLALPYCTALVGDRYACFNPWRVLVEYVERGIGRPFSGHWPYPLWLGDYPALILYIGFIWLELFGHLTPYGLSVALGIYSAICVLGAVAFGSDIWFRHGEFFAMMMRFIGKLAPYRAGGRWQPPFLGLLDVRTSSPGATMFVLFMLASTAFDGIHDTVPWAGLFWKGLYPLVRSHLGDPAAPAHYALAGRVYFCWQWLALLLSPILYFRIFSIFVFVTKIVARARIPVRELTACFAPTLVPIALVYHLAHYFTLLLLQAGQIVRVVSDPFGWGWNIFGTADMIIGPIMLEARTIWHVQISLILIGHIVSVYLAHLQAARLFGGPLRATLSQLPMLVLMMALTTFGLWILSLPLQAI